MTTFLFVSMAARSLSETGGCLGGVLGGGRAVLIDAMRIPTLVGPPALCRRFVRRGSVLANSFISAQGQAVFAERGVTVRNNVITSEGVHGPFSPQYGAYVFDNQLTCRGDTCVTIIGRRSVVSKNLLTSTGTAIKIMGAYQSDTRQRCARAYERFVPGGGGEPVFIGLAGEVAIEVQTTRNTIRGNFVEPVSPRLDLPISEPGRRDVVPWRVGIQFAPQQLRQPLRRQSHGGTGAVRPRSNGADRPRRQPRSCSISLAEKRAVDNETPPKRGLELGQSANDAQSRRVEYPHCITRATSPRTKPQRGGIRSVT